MGPGASGSSGLQVKWDDGYDGTWDTAYAAPAPHAITSKTAGPVPTKARVRDAAGHVAEAVVWVTFGAAGSSSASSSGASGSGGEGGGSGHVIAPKSSGCGCRTAGARSGASFAGASLAALALVVARRRRRARVG
jgi:MYXO-CTERM domain-containing protein